MTILRPTWAEIDLKAIQENFDWISQLVGPDTDVMGVIKADAYGHGAAAVARVLEERGIRSLGVSSLDEALELRRFGIQSPILVLGSVLPDLHPVSGDPLLPTIEFTVCTVEVAKVLQQEAHKQQRPFLIHVKVDTGMGRLGVWYEQAARWIGQLLEFDGIQLEGIYTHFASVDEGELHTTLEQVGRFAWLLEMLEVQRISVKYRHAANSLAAVRFPAARFNRIRPGILLYGVWPTSGTLAESANTFIKPAFSLKTRIVFLKQTPAGRSLGYGHTFTTSRSTRIATLPIGYADGYPSSLSNHAWVLIRGSRAPVVGRVSMDQTLVDVGHIPEVRVGDEVVLIGGQQEEQILVEEVSRWAERIPYELLCGITDRVPRVYLTGRESAEKVEYQGTEADGV